MSYASTVSQSGSPTNNKKDISNRLKELKSSRQRARFERERSGGPIKLTRSKPATPIISGSITPMTESNTMLKSLEDEDRLEMEPGTLRSQITELESELKECRARVAAAEVQVSTQSEIEERLRDQVCNLEAELRGNDRINSDDDLMPRRNEELHATRKALEDSQDLVRSLRKEMDKLKKMGDCEVCLLKGQECDRLRAKLVECEEKLSHTRRENGEKERDDKLLRATIQAKEETIATLEARIGREKAESEAAVRRLERLRPQSPVPPPRSFANRPASPAPTIDLERRGRLERSMQKYWKYTVDGSSRGTSWRKNPDELRSNASITSQFLAYASEERLHTHREHFREIPREPIPVS